VAETPEPNVVEGMRWLLSTYTIRLNHRHKLFGHVFSGRYKALLVEGESSGYLRTVCGYVHLNPVRAGLLQTDEPVSAYPWSSLHWCAAAAAHRPPWLRVDRLLGEYALGKDTPLARTDFLRRIESRRRSEEQEEESLQAIRRGPCFGSPAFR
jgi:putative transposase